MAEQDFIKAGFKVVGSENNENKLLSFLKENYPNVIRDTEINLEELKTVLGLPIDEKVNGYGLNFVGRNFARAKYAQKTEKELRLNTKLSKNLDTTQNLVLKGDNLDSLRILKNYYSGQIKCIYIDPPYNTDKDEFVYPDKFDKEEAQVLGLANLSESDFARMDFSFKSQKSHNGWLAFMYPRLLLARDLLSKDGVIFISIDDNEQANLKLLCDDIFNEECFIATMVVNRASEIATENTIQKHEYLLCYTKNISEFRVTGIPKFSISRGTVGNEGQTMPVITFPKGLKCYGIANGTYTETRKISGSSENIENLDPIIVENETLMNEVRMKAKWRSSNDMRNFFNNNCQPTEAKINGIIEEIYFENDRFNPQIKKATYEKLPSLFLENKRGSKYLDELDLGGLFDNPKDLNYISKLINIVTDSNSIILDFFAGSGTTGQAVMELNKDGGNRKFILCQIDEPIKEDKPAYKFCIDNNLPPVISSITVERLRRAGEKISNDIEAENSKTGLFEEDKKQIPDIGFKVFDSVEAPKLKVDDKGQISFSENQTDALSRIYNMVFTVGLDEPTQVPEEVVKDCIYKIGNHYYITNSEKITSDDYSNAIKNGKVFIDGWTASLNGTLQNYKEDVKIVF
ncbi:MAG TPA: site-specific DNA-methyltransferase [Planctomycetota bacterium]|nr:site-specific DNA-methyltransferase [Planctomycetota bacterium]